MTDERCSVCGRPGSYILGPPAAVAMARYCQAHLPPLWHRLGATAPPSPRPTSAPREQRDLFDL